MSRPTSRALLLVLALLAALGALTPLRAQDSADKPIAGAPIPTDGRQVTTQIATWTSQLDAIEKQIGAGTLAEEDLPELRREIDATLSAARALADLANAALADKRQLLDALGPPPADDSTKEAPEVARQRASLNSDIADLDGRAKRAQVIATRAESMLGIVVETSRQQLAARILGRETSPFAIDLWREGLPQTIEALSALADTPRQWWESDGTPDKVAAAWPTVLLVIAFATVMGWPIRRWLLRRGGPRMDIPAPPYGRRVLAACAAGLASCAIPVLAIASIYGSLEAHGLLFGGIEELARGLAVGLSLYFVIAGFSHVALQPHLPQWRVARLSEDSADTLDARLKFLAVILGLNSFIWIGFRLDGSGDAFRTIVNVFMNATLAFGLWPMLGDRAWRRSEAAVSLEATGGEAVDPRKYATARRLLRLFVLAIPLTAAAGYYNLSDYIARNIILAGLLFGMFSALSTIVGELAAAMLNAPDGSLRKVRTALGFSDEAGGMAHFWITGFFNVVLAGVLFTLFLPSAGVPWDDIAAFFETGISGVHIGNFTISFTDILLGIVIFVVALRLTRMVQRLLERRLLPQTRLDTGVQNSIKSAAGYVGTTIGIVIAISVAGIDFSNIAIIAGALSVGIGFGLQNIVNNFISGLIVLVERPVKVGDWVIIGGNEGIVKRINVRATEIETFKRATVIVPNGELISQSLVNYTLHNKMGRVDIPVGVAYGTDPGQVEKVLFEVAANHKAVLSFPKPRVLFQNFGASTLDFELRCFVANVEESLVVRTELMFAVERIFREREIEIPFPQSDINIRDRDIEKLAALLDRVFARNAAEGNRTAAPTGQNQDRRDE
ncbi:mechanosensitive ion channel family protein [Zavarzinia sp.]|uniref:mechanosensitive ion channel family protein n=1 Tax=Zavarzinia sp. TaxID=2027920 RepID=UPI003BB75F7A